MLTRDIELSDAILDLLDNCLDGVVRQKKGINKMTTSDYAASHKEVKRNLAGTGVLNHAGSDSFRDSLPIFKGMRICPT